MWILCVVLASTLQVARNALQRSVMGSSGPWGATLVRFLFGLPFSWLFVVLAVGLMRDVHPSWNTSFWFAALIGAAAQVLATACLLLAMKRSGFAIGTALQQSSLPLAAIIGTFVFHDFLSQRAWSGVVITTCGLAVLSFQSQRSEAPRSFSGGCFGLLSGLFFGLSLNAFRHASLSLEPAHPIFGALASVAVVQTIQTLALTLVLGICDRQALIAVIIQWRQSLAAGCCGSCASAAWFLALAMTPAASVRAVGIIEAPIAAIAGRRFFKEELTIQQLLAGAAVIGGVLLTVV